ncbi:hypothetical protein GCM10009554_42650 [Kribbella koreensis]
MACDGDVRSWLDDWQDTRDLVRGGEAPQPLRGPAKEKSNEVVVGWPAAELRWLTRRRATVLGLVVGVIAAGAFGGVTLTRRFAGDPHCESGPCVFMHGESDVTVWSDSTTNSHVVGRIPNRASVQMLCWSDHQMLRPPRANYASDRWFKIEAGTLTGFVHSASVYSQSQVPHC